MKQTAAILLLGMMVFNFCGYRFLASYFEDKSNARLEAQFDNNNYDESQLISIKIPATNYSYYTNSKSFDRVDGKIEINGVEYKFFKRRLYNDSLELLCIPDYDVARLRTARDDFFKMVNDLQQNGAKKTGSHSSSSKSFTADYFMSNNNSLINNFDISYFKPISNYQFSLNSFNILFRGQPPKIS